MPTLISNIAHRIRQVYQKAGDFIEEQREFPVSQVFLNATFKRYVTDNVGLLKDLHADLHDDWLRLYATVDIMGLYAVLSVDLKLLQMEMNKDTQLIVFEQISDTQVIESKFNKWWLKIAVNSALFFYQKVLRRDPLGIILEKYNIVKVKDELLHLDLNRWLGKSRPVLDTLNKVHINHATLRETELVVMGNVNLTALISKFGIFDRESESTDIEIEQESDVTPIQQK
ncbi:hypothetical protein EC844_10112 [Acinetobacter calcoaceticus]|uniref:Uncharacterized protein n=1 Tax=Acinetobacter calcoaceticus TaxID=471 RepID=A0A4R1YA43_ACICA|nr:hypothetical protein EC844_10112 [Acinetobacter calcoaceticus]